MTTTRPSCTSRLYGERSPCAYPARANRRIASITCSSSGAVRRGPSRDCGEARRSDRAVADELHQQFGAVDLHRVRHGSATLVHQAQRLELGECPVVGGERAPVGRPLLECAGVAAATGAPTLLVLGRSVEVAMLGRAVALGRQDAALRRRIGGGQAGREPFDQEQVCLFAGLDDAEFGVDRAGGGDDPVRPRLGAALAGGDGGPGGPSLVVAGLDGGEGEFRC